MTTTFNASAHWSMSPHVSLREEDFGALAYDHLTRRLVFLKSPTLVALVSRLGEYENVDQAIEALVSIEQRVRYQTALASLARSGIIRAG